LDRGAADSVPAKAWLDREVIYAGTELHGMRLIAPNMEPQPMTLIQEFLELVFGIKVK